VVFVLSRRIKGREGKTIDVIQDVSPHPFPNFLREPGTTFVVSQKYVIGNGAYLGMGLPPYPGAKDLVPYYPGQSGMRSGASDPETALLYSQWNLYKLTVDLWKEQRFERPPALRSLVGDANGPADNFYPPRDETVNDVRESLRRLETQMSDIENGVDALRQEFDVFVSNRTQTTDIMRFRAEVAALRPKIALLRNYFDSVSGMGVTSAPTRDDARYFRVLQFLSAHLNERAAAYENALAQQHEARRRLALEQAAREVAARRAAWSYVKAQAGAACASPGKLAAMQQSGGARTSETGARCSRRG
jgi:hypothetical protein